MKKNTSPTLRRDYITENGLDQITSLDIFAISELHQFDKKEILIHADQPSRFLYFLVQGETIVTREALDKTVCLNYCQPLSWLGEASSLWQQQPSCSVQALTPCTCIAIDLSAHRDALVNDILFLQNTCQILNFKLNESTYHRSDLADPLEMRLAKFILRHSPRDTFSLQLTNCAIILNASYRHLLRILKEYCDQGLLEKQKSRYTIRDRHTLERYAEGLLPG